MNGNGETRNYIGDVGMINPNLMLLRGKLKGETFGDSELITLSYLINKARISEFGNECNVSNDDLLAYFNLEDTPVNQTFISRKIKRLKDCGLIAVDGRPPNRVFIIKTKLINHLIDMRLDGVSF